MTAIHCPHCGHPIRSYVMPMEEKIAALGSEWETVATGASKWYRAKLRVRYPQAEFRQFPINLTGDLFRIEARRRDGLPLTP